MYNINNNIKLNHNGICELLKFYKIQIRENITMHCLVYIIKFKTIIIKQTIMM